MDALDAFLRVVDKFWLSGAIFMSAFWGVRGVFLADDGKTVSTGGKSTRNGRASSRAPTSFSSTRSVPLPDGSVSMF
jgi:hypothetical protein